MKRDLHLMGPLLFLAACGEMPPEDVGSRRSPITGGTLLPEGLHGAPDTSSVKIDVGGIKECTALKVTRQPFSQTVFWTAGHCLNQAAVGTSIRLTNNLDGDFSGPNSYSTTINWMLRHPSRQNWANAITEPSRDGRLFNYDVAQFSVVGSTSNIPAYNLSSMDYMEAQEQVTYTGYGCDGINSTNSGKKQYAFFDLVFPHEVEPFWFEKTELYVSHYMAAVGDSPQGCPGDSGSPVWKWFGADWRTVGIAVHGGEGYTGFARFSNVGNWLKAPSLNNFNGSLTGASAGTLMNELSGLCITIDNNGNIAEGICDTRGQTTSPAYWRLRSKNGLSSGPYQIVNGQNGQCLDIANASAGALLVVRPCNDVSTIPFSTQRWDFTATNHADYRRLVNTSTGRCTRPTHTNSDFGTIRSYACDNLSTWRQQAYMFYN